jgi:hypothetical protein
LEEFKWIASTPQRRAYVRRIGLIIELESYDQNARASFETDEERQRNNRIFTTTISSLFRILSEWPDDSGIALKIRAQSPGDYQALKDKAEIRKRLRVAKMLRVNDLLHRRYERSYLEFSKTTTNSECPPVLAISSLSIEGLAKSRLIQPASSIFIASKLPKLNSVHLEMKDECRRDEQLRQHLRNGKLHGINTCISKFILTVLSEFARHIHCFPSSVRKFHLHFHYAPPRDESYPPPDVTENGTDLLSSHLRHFSQRLERFELVGTVIGPEIFEPLHLQNGNLKLPFWPNLVDISVEYPPIRPSGEWLFDRGLKEHLDDDMESDYEPDSDHENDYPEHVRIPVEDRKLKFFRSKIIPRHFDRLYLAAGEAALRMPKLRQMKLLVEGSRPRYTFQYEVQAEVTMLSWSNEEVPNVYQGGDALIRLEQAKRRYQPDEQVFELWRKVALQNTGSGLQIKFREYPV